jgi:cathepsin L
MKLTASLLAMLGVASAIPSFEEWIKQHQKPWRAGSPEFLERKSLFLERVKEVIAHNANPKKTYTKGINKFSASTVGEMKSLTGAVPELMGAHSPKNSKTSNIQMKNVEELPESVDWRDQGVLTPVKDQGHCGSCWAFSTTETLEAHVAINTGLLFSLSPQQVASCVDNVNQCGGIGGCSGGMPQVAFDSIANAQQGITQEFEYAYNSYFGEDFECKTMDNKSNTPTAVAEIDGYVQVTPNNYTELMNTIAQVGPVSIVLDASTWSSYEGGVFDGCDYDNIELDHAVQLVGYGECPEHGKYWLVRNSWSPAWGEGGYIKIKRSDNDDEKCDHTMNGGRCKGEPLKADACGTCGIMYSPSYPSGAKLYEVEKPDPHP